MKNSFLAVVLATIASASFAQVDIEPTWKISGSAGTGSLTYAWFPSTGDVARGMAYNAATGNLLVASRGNSATQIYRLNAADGTERTPNTVPAPAGGFTGGGGNALNKVAATSDGVIFACNLDTAQGFKIYRAADETSQFVAVYTQNATADPASLREGDDFIVRRIDANTIEAVASGTTSNLVVYTSTDNGLTFSSRSVIAITGSTLSTASHVRFDPVNPNTTLWARSSSVNQLLQINRSTGAATLFNDNQAARQPFDVRVDSNNAAQRLYTIGIGSSSAGSGDLSATVRSTAAPQTVIANLRRQSAGAITGGNNVANGNGAGDIIIVGGTTYTLYTNNSIAAYANTPLPVSVSGFSID